MAVEQDIRSALCCGFLSLMDFEVGLVLPIDVVSTPALSIER